MLRGAVRETFRADWEQWRAVLALPCTVAIALSLVAGLAIHQPMVGLMAASGAMSVGFGSFQRLGRSRVTPMLLASVGMAIATAAGSLAAHSAAGLAINAAAVGLIFGLMNVVSAGTAWITLQCAIFALIATGYPAPLELVLVRATSVLAGGLLQMGIVLLFRRLHIGFVARTPADTFAGWDAALQILRANLTWRSAEFRYAVRLAATLAVAATLAHALALSNGYWVPMTALLVLRTDLHETLTRGLARVAGTIIGAGLATLLVSVLRPEHSALTVLIVLCAWLCYSVVNVNYGAFSVSVTAYIAFLLALAGLPEREVVLHRVANTSLGGALALAASLLAAHFAIQRRKRELSPAA